MRHAVIEQGVKFLCALQPNPDTSSGTISYSMQEMRIQIGSAYPLIKDKARNLSCFVDYSERLLVDNFTDSCCHVNELGNREISSMLSSTILTSINCDYRTTFSNIGIETGIVVPPS